MTTIVGIDPGVTGALWPCSVTVASPTSKTCRCMTAGSTVRGSSNYLFDWEPDVGVSGVDAADAEERLHRLVLASG